MLRSDCINAISTDGIIHLDLQSISSCGFALSSLEDDGGVTKIRKLPFTVTLHTKTITITHPGHFPFPLSDNIIYDPR